MLMISRGAPAGVACPPLVALTWRSPQSKLQRRARSAFKTASCRAFFARAGCHRMIGDRERRGVLSGTEPDPVSPRADTRPFATRDPLPAPADVIAGKYKVERVLGAGGMGVVLAARHLHLPQRVAIKFLRAEAAQEKSAVDRFLREAQAAVALSSEHVARVLDVGTLESGEPYMVMEYLDGTDLARTLVEHGPMPIADAVGAVLQACEAIAEAHALGIIHRDLKPANLFLNRRRDGTSIIKVLDFGISKTLDWNEPGVSENLTASGLVMGSPGYMSPEQVRSAKDVDGRTDIWSLGVILYELTTGVRPFVGRTLGEVLALIVSEDVPSVRRHRTEIPEGLAAVIAQCLERRVDRRIQDVGALASKLVAYGPRGGEGSLERILRWRAVASAGEATADTMPMPGPEVAPVAETGRPWLKAGGSSRARRPGSSVHLVAMAGGGVALVVGLGMYALGARIASGRNAVAPVAASAPVAEGAPDDSTRGSAAPSAGKAAGALPNDSPSFAATASPSAGPPDARGSIVAPATPVASASPPPRPPPKPLPAKHVVPQPSATATSHEIDVF
jgi:serine/threonine-protein kinase